MSSKQMWNEEGILLFADYQKIFKDLNAEEGAITEQAELGHSKPVTFSEEGGVWNKTVSGEVSHISMETKMKDRDWGLLKQSAFLSLISPLLKKCVETTKQWHSLLSYKTLYHTTAFVE